MQFLDISIMQTRSRDLPRPQSPKKSLSKNGNSLNSKLFNLIGTIQLTIHRSTKLCLATFEYVITLQINGFFFSNQSPITSNSFNQTSPLQSLNIAKHRNDASQGFKLCSQLKQNKKKKKNTIKSVSILINSFLSCDGSRK